jgi:nucleoside-diphosphate-sugar epimerase
VRILVTGGSGVLGRAAMPLLRAEGHVVSAPSRAELDLFDPGAVAEAVAGMDAVLHLATGIPPSGVWDDREVWRENDRLRREASALLVDAALATAVRVYIQPSVTFVYPSFGPVDESTPLADVPEILRSALDAEAAAARFAAGGRDGVVLRLGLLDGPGTDHASPAPRFGATLDVEDAGHALVAALSVPSGIYNVCRDGERVSNERFRRVSGWGPRR